MSTIFLLSNENVNLPFIVAWWKLLNSATVSRVKFDPAALSHLDWDERVATLARYLEAAQPDDAHLVAFPSMGPQERSQGQVGRPCFALDATFAACCDRDQTP